MFVYSYTCSPSPRKHLAIFQFCKKMYNRSLQTYLERNERCIIIQSPPKYCIKSLILWTISRVLYTSVHAKRVNLSPTGKYQPHGPQTCNERESRPRELDCLTNACILQVVIFKKERLTEDHAVYTVKQITYQLNLTLLQWNLGRATSSVCLTSPRQGSAV